MNALVNPKENLNQAPHDNLEPILNRLLHHARPSSLLYIISDFRGLTPHAETQLTKLSQHCDVVLIFIYDELEKICLNLGNIVLRKILKVSLSI